jgi:PTS system cellobiose-specific IIB component
MKKIMLVCSAGMSTSLLVTKMEKSAKELNIDVEIFAMSEGEAVKHYDSVQLVLLGPQVRYLKKKLQKELEDKDLVVEVIDSLNYGTMNGKKVLENAMNILGEA